MAQCCVCIEAVKSWVCSLDHTKLSIIILIYYANFLHTDWPGDWPMPSLYVTGSAKAKHNSMFFKFHLIKSSSPYAYPSKVSASYAQNYSSYSRGWAYFAFFFPLIFLSSNSFIFPSYLFFSIFRSWFSYDSNHENFFLVYLQRCISSFWACVTAALE